MSQFRIGVLLFKKKAEALGLTCTVAKSLQESSIEVVFIDEKLPLESQGPFHIIIHKISDFLRDAENGDTQALKIIEELKNYERDHKDNCYVMDQVSVVLDLANREKMSQLCEQACFKLGDIRVSVPNWIKIDKYNLNLLTTTDFQVGGLQFPLLCKALNAAEGPGAHDMQLIFDFEQLKELEVVPCIAQNFVNHDMKLCKIFVVGSSWCIVNRPSIRNFNVKETIRNGSFPIKSIFFDSHDVSKPDSSSFLNHYGKGFRQYISFGNNELLSDLVVEELIKRLKQIFPFTLLGIDVIVDGNTYGLIDINFLPGYDGMTNFYSEFENLLREKLKDLRACKSN